MLVGNPELTDPSILGSIVSKLVSGVVLLASKDKREIGYRAKDVKSGYDSITCIYTGEIPKKPQVAIMRKQEFSRKTEDSLSLLR